MEQSPKNILKIARIAFAGIIILLLCVAALCIYRVNDLEVSRKRITDLQQLAELQEQLISASKDFVIGARGYYIMKDSTYIKPFESGKAVYKANILKLDSFYNHFNLDTEGKLKGMIRRRLRHTEIIIGKTKRNEMDSAVQAIKNANPIIDSINRQARVVRMEVNTRVNTQVADHAQKFKIVTWLIGALAFIVLIILVTFFFWLKYDISGRIKAEHALQDKNQELQYAYEDLESKITFRNLELEQENDKLKKQIKALENR